MAPTSRRRHATWSPFDVPLGGGTFGVRLFGSDDELVALSDIGDDFESSVAFHRADVYYQARRGAWWVLASEAFSFEDEASFGSAQQDFTFSTRVEARWSGNEHVGVIFGTETRAGWSNLDLAAPAGGLGPAGPSEPQLAASDDSTPVIVPAAYATANFRFGPDNAVTISPGVRVTTVAVPMAKSGIDPRLGARWNVAERWALKSGVGIYTQAPSLAELDEVFGNPDLEIEKSLQSSAGFEVQLPVQLSLDLTGFYKQLWDVAVPSDRII